MATLLAGNKVRLDNGQVIVPKNGEWYDGQHFLNGQLGSAGVDLNTGHVVSQQVANQTNPNNAAYLAGKGAYGGSNGSGGSSSSNPLADVNKAIEDSFQKLQDEVVKRFGEYRQGQPFRVDEVLADKTKEASEQIDPYYNQLLGDYLTGVQTKLDRGVNDTKDLLTELTASTASYTEQAKNNLDNATDQAAQGYADAGLNNSGQALRSEGQLKQDTGNTLDQYGRKAALQEKQLNLGLERNTQDINSAKKDYVTNLEQNRFTDTQTRASQLTKEAGQQYIQGFQGALPPQLQSASGFDMLKSLGIYS